MTQSGAGLALLLVISTAFATAPAAAQHGHGGGGGFGGGGFHGGGFGGGGFRGGGFGGGGFHGGGGGGRAFSVPNFAPRISAPRMSAPHFAPRISAPRISAPHMARPAVQTPRVAPQRVARPVEHPQHPATTGGIPSARTSAASTPHMQHLPPANQAGRAFALANAHAAVSGHTLRNPFIANRPGLARATFQGRFAQLPFRHFHRHFLRPIVIGWFGPLFWPYAYDDFLGYTLYPYAYDTFWPYAYDDLYDGMFGLYEPPVGAAYAATGTYAATGRQAPSSGGRAVERSIICSGQTAGVTDWRIDEIAQAVEPNDAQRAALDELKTAMARSLEILKAACPTELASTPNGRIAAMQARLSAMLEAVRTVRAPLAKFYDQLSDEQRARFNALGSSEGPNEQQARRDLTQVCNERASGIAALPMERIERTVQPDDAQRAAFRDLQNAISQAGELLKSNCPSYKPLTPVVRLEVMEQRLDAMLRAVDTVQPALAKFYGSLSDEQKERFNRLAPGQG
jgi:ABC-type transporter MlaC component